MYFLFSAKSYTVSIWVTAQAGLQSCRGAAGRGSGRSPRARGCQGAPQRPTARDTGSGLEGEALEATPRSPAPGAQAGAPHLLDEFHLLLWDAARGQSPGPAEPEGPASRPPPGRGRLPSSGSCPVRLGRLLLVLEEGAAAVPVLHQGTLCALALVLRPLVEETPQPTRATPTWRNKKLRER